MKMTIKFTSLLLAIPFVVLGFIYRSCEMGFAGVGFQEDLRPPSKP